MRLNLITAFTKNYGIGKNGVLPWKINEELQLFKLLTTSKGNNAVLMGKNTWYSIPTNHRPLKDRQNIVISSEFKTPTMMYKNPTLIKEDDGFLFFGFNNIDEAMNNIYKLGVDDLYIIGGNKMYEYCLRNYFIDKMIITEIEEDYDCNVFFPHFELNNYLKYFEISKNYDCYYKNKIDIDDIILYADEQLEKVIENDKDYKKELDKLEKIVNNNKFTTFIHDFRSIRFKMPYSIFTDSLLNTNRKMNDIEYSFLDKYADVKRKELLQHKIIVNDYLISKL